VINKASLGPAAASIGPAAGGVGCGHSFGSHSLGVGKREGRRGGDGESLKILQEGVDKIGDPQTYEAEGMAKATHSPAVAHEQQEAMIPGTCPSGGRGGVEVCAGEEQGGLSRSKGSVSVYVYADCSECGKPKAPLKVHILNSIPYSVFE